MNPIERSIVQPALDSFLNQEVYLHLETTNGAYAAHRQESKMTIGAYIRNGRISYIRGTITGEGPYRVGLKMKDGWVYAEGLTDFDLEQEGKLLLAGHDEEGRLAVALELSLEPFEL
ncbi:YojF family protein [Desulfosporosinus sp. FKB]|uniref:YojF family protein n=1 Tax=Desulfosporosinus sp. FKB TaxID=1969835 RepID=UPI000B49DDD9|nr:YojF family protein [Desulfosporosinus sp. FKB]